MILRPADDRTTELIQEAFRVCSPADICRGRDNTGYVATDLSKRYHELVPVKVFEIDYSQLPSINDKYERAVFRVQYKAEQAERRRIDAKQPLTHLPIPEKLPVFKPTPSNPRGHGIKVTKSDVAKMSDFERQGVLAVREDSMDYYIRPPNDQAEIDAHGYLLKNVLTRTDRLGDELSKSEGSGEQPLRSTANEKYFFHGTNSGAVERIIANGFNGVFAGAGLFGAGIYFAESPTKSDQYARLSSKDNYNQLNKQSVAFDDALKERLGIKPEDYNDAVESLCSGKDNAPSKDIFYMFVARGCLGLPMLLDFKGCCWENASGNRGSYEYEHHKVTAYGKNKVCTVCSNRARITACCQYVCGCRGWTGSQHTPALLGGGRVEARWHYRYIAAQIRRWIVRFPDAAYYAGRL